MECNSKKILSYLLFFIKNPIKEHNLWFLLLLLYKETQKHKTMLSIFFWHLINFFSFLILTYQGKQHKNFMYTESRFFSNEIKSVNRIIKQFNMHADSALSAAICKYAWSCIKPGYFLFIYVYVLYYVILDISCRFAYIDL